MNAADRLIESVRRTQNPTVAGLDTRFEYIPIDLGCSAEDPEAASQAVYDFNRKLIDQLYDIVPAVKVQIAFYEMYGLYGLSVFQKTLKYAKDAGMSVISDAKRGDIGSTAQAYSTAFLGEPEIAGRKLEGFQSDFVTVNPYFGTDGVQPFINDCDKYDKGIFVLVKTSNPSGSEIQDLVVDGAPVYEHIGKSVMYWGENLIGEYGYSSVGAVVGATFPEQGKRLRELLPTVFFLLPGYGAQGAKGSDLAGCFDADGHGAIVNASRSLICAYKKHPGIDFARAAREEALRMRDDLMASVKVIK